MTGYIIIGILGVAVYVYAWFFGGIRKCYKIKKEQQKAIERKESKV